MNDVTKPLRDDPLGQDELARAILAYLAERPQALDTLEGIATWWLLRQHVHTEVQRVAGALERLTAQGLLERVGSGPSCRYRARRDSAEKGEGTSPLPSPDLGTDSRERDTAPVP